jgi:hypothetical protein
MDWIEIAALVLVVGWLLWSSAIRRRSPRHIHAVEKALMSLPQYTRVDAAKYGFLDLAFYRATQADLERAGYRLLGDVTDRRMEARWTPVRSFVRILVSEDGTEQAGIFHVRLNGPLGWVMRRLGMKDQRVVELETELSDGGFLVTTTVDRSLMLSQPEEFEHEFLPNDASARTVAYRHAERVAVKLRERPEIHAVIVETLDDALQSQIRGELIKIRRRRKLDGITREEMLALAPKGMVGEAALLHDELRGVREHEDTL